MPQFWENPTAHNAFVLSWISLVITLVAAVGGIIAYFYLDSSLILCYGLENCVDFISSAIVLWRFYRPGKDDSAREELLADREIRASVAISLILTLLGFGTIVAAAEDFAAGNEEETNLWVLYYISFFSLIVFGAMSIFKFHYAHKLDSPSLNKDGICSLMGTVLAASLFVNTVIILATDGAAWWLDPTIALIAGVASLAIGLYGIYEPFVMRGIPVLSPKWWLYHKQSTNSNTNLSEVESQLQMKQQHPPQNYSQNRPMGFQNDMMFSDQEDSEDQNSPVRQSPNMGSGDVVCDKNVDSTIKNEDAILDQSMTLESSNNNTTNTSSNVPHQSNAEDDLELRKEERSDVELI
mmetsp:Transcript_21371/g.29956  ORF Transcript_21371/g.29956 Transcript_21371/m.29956 type:complete len:352 (-) Transcript_21371:347-1402(-)|eukprot:CAMPEP_0184870610 /NCGR_PEP_ID=MMETSP0580-20130426/38110_1 /TAXON_ID=1118495 /ORGANISM="Dactyliosolen fragilissimus" /LENGTH=351 /DNA_ID=CAMNT_0027372777 /DNA_START=204 /DNA_END=1259 /DNA_ORIENTATION=+